MKRNAFLLTVGFCLLAFFSLNAQVAVKVTVTDGEATTTCSDFLTQPDPLWQVNVAQTGWQTYPAIGPCFQAPPVEQYSESYPCVADLPTEIEVCFEAFENDDVGFEIGVSCDLAPDCLESVCQIFLLPAPGESLDYTLNLPTGLSSGGFVDFTISVGETFDSVNDLPCDAIDLGQIAPNTMVGDATLGIYGNTCATNVNEPNPGPLGFFNNDHAVWFTFTAADVPGQLLRLEGLTDPEGVGDTIDLQFGLYESDDGTCAGNLTFLLQASDINSLNAVLPFYCPTPGARYFLMVDGGYALPGSTRGVFGLQITSFAAEEGGDLRCDAVDLGTVPEGGAVTTDTIYSNFCATGAGDPFSPNFVTQTSVWFRFVAPPSGHVIIDGVAEDPEPLGVQLGLYRSINGQCTGFYAHVASQFTLQDLSESLEVSCLFPGEPYWVLVDGSGSRGRGLFSLSVTDAGDITPVTTIDTTICAGDTYAAGNSLYTESGLYSDTIQVFAGCDSIVISNLTVLSPIEVVITSLQPAIGAGTTNGVASVAAAGGAGVFTFDWCTGETGNQATQLPGGEECCVTVTDDFGCQTVECFTVDFVNPVEPVFSNDTLACHGDANGAITFSVQEGRAPYLYTWQNTNNTLSGNGVINAEGEGVTIDDLPAGTYQFSVSDAYTSTTFTAQVLEPEPLVVSLVSLQDASCFGFCDGAVTVSAAGGTGAYTYEWSGGLPDTPTPTGICAGDYTLVVRDENNCEAVLTLDVKEPVAFLLTTEELQPVSCFGGSDGRAGVIATNGTPIQYLWDTGATTPAIEGLIAGSYAVTVTNADGCEASATVEVTEPSAPLSVSIQEVRPVSCFDAADGILAALPGGPGTTFTYFWNNGQTSREALDLGPGTYSVTVTNENGCTAEADLTITAPPPIEVSWIAQNLTCADPTNGGAILLETISGGVPDYAYSLDGVVYRSVPAFTGLFEGGYTVWVQDAVGCEVGTAVEVAGPPELSVSLGTDLQIGLGESVQLEAEASSSAVTYQWRSSLGDTLSPLGAFLEVRPLETTVYTVTVFDTETFCTATDNVMVSVNTERRVYIPNAFSPNGDGMNDEFMIYGGEDVVGVTEFRIFNRAGGLLFEAEGFAANDPDVAWDGNFRGQALNSGVYVYYAVIEFLDGKEEVFSGEITLLR